MDIKFGEYNSLITEMLTTVNIYCTNIKESTLNAKIGTDTRAKNWNHEQNSWKARPRTRRKSVSVLEPEPEPPDILRQF